MSGKAVGVPAVAAGPDDLVLFERVLHDEVHIAVVTLNRPEAMNPLDSSTIQELCVRLADLESDPELRAIVLTGAGQAFSAGGDLKAYQTLFQQPDRFDEFLRDFAETCRILERSPLLTIAMVNGTCVAGGLELALACDIVTIAENARIGDGHLRFGQLPGAGSSQRLLRALGSQRARYWLLSGELFTARTAVEVGLAVDAVPSEALRDFTLDLAARACRHSPTALARMKDLISVALTEPFDEGLETERRVALSYATNSNDAREGLEAFAEGRTPRYEHR